MILIVTAIAIITTIVTIRRRTTGRRIAAATMTVKSTTWKPFRFRRELFYPKPLNPQALKP